MRGVGTAGRARVLPTECVVGRFEVVVTGAPWAERAGAACRGPWLGWGAGVRERADEQRGHERSLLLARAVLGCVDERVHGRAAVSCRTGCAEQWRLWMRGRTCAQRGHAGELLLARAGVGAEPERVRR